MAAREELVEQAIEQEHLARRVDEVVVDDLETRVRIARPVEQPGCAVSRGRSMADARWLQTLRSCMTMFCSFMLGRSAAPTNARTHLLTLRSA